jgi:succinate dehydrogenase/fumarate reductase cytochrome b subunit
LGHVEKGYLRKFNRLLVWPTLVLFILLAISGYALLNPRLVGELTGGVFNRTFSSYLHEILILPTLTLLSIHTLIGIRMTLIRWGVREGKLLNAFLLILGAFALFLMALMQYLVI